VFLETAWRRARLSPTTASEVNAQATASCCTRFSTWLLWTFGHCRAQPRCYDFIMLPCPDAHSVFVYKSFHVQVEAECVVVTYDFLVNGAVYRPSIRFGCPVGANDKLSGPLLGRLGLIEALSYWKAFLSPILRVEAFPFVCGEHEWWERFFALSMAEFCYRNTIPLLTSEVLELQGVVISQPLAWSEEHTDPGRVLTMFSGGKDSLIAALLAAQAGLEQDFFFYNPTPVQYESQLKNLGGQGTILTLARDILPALLELNKLGAPNGHTPFSAYLGLSAVILALSQGIGFVCAGNTRSDDEPNVRDQGLDINHQWTKSLDFELELNRLLSILGIVEVRYFSILRPFYELQVLKAMLHHPLAFSHVQSCNKVRRGYCLRCAKCAWIGLALSTLVSNDEARLLMNGDVFGHDQAERLFKSMAGLEGTKPFECTGSEVEVRACLNELALETPPTWLATLQRHPAVLTAPSTSHLLSRVGEVSGLPRCLRVPDVLTADLSGLWSR
jgi:UDP-N-acetyl-alpha-D-muramoyl-L-alanyl-L-glutamate epimerase